jgi:predicted transcriptional regulator
MTTAKILHEALQGLNIKQQKRISELSGVPWRTLYKIKRGFTTDPKSSTVDRLLSVLRSAPVSSVALAGKSSSQQKDMSA